ncbi:MAG: peptide deformylase [Clostridia bacterium]|nr:peptide deformylase [Clostridia bacterium]
MAIRTIREEDDEILRKKSREVEVIDEKIKTLVDDMVETMHKFDGLGLAAVQVGVLKRIVVIDLYDDKGVIVLINPVITKEKGKQIVEEGCLSFPNKFAKVERPEQVTVEALNINGEKIKLTGKGLLAQAIAHEVDHLNGEVFIDKIMPGTLEIVTPESQEK